MVGWHHRFSGHEFGQAPRDSQGQGGPVCCRPSGHRVGRELATKQGWCRKPRTTHWLSRPEQQEGGMLFRWRGPAGLSAKLLPPVPTAYSGDQPPAAGSDCLLAALGPVLTGPSRYLHHFAVLAPVQRVELVRSELMRRGRGRAAMPGPLFRVTVGVHVLLLAGLLVCWRGGVRKR